MGGISNPGANTQLSNLIPTSINQSLVPNADGTLNLGSATNEWLNLRLAATGSVNWAASDVTISNPSANLLAFAGAANGYSFDNPVNSNNATSSTLQFQTQTFTAGVAHNAVLVNPTWATENFAHRAIQISPTQNGANTNALVGLSVTMTKATGATTLATMQALLLNAPAVTGTVTSSFAIDITDQTNGSITTPRGLRFATVGVANSIVWGGSALQYANAAEDVRFMDSTNTRGVALTLTAAAAQTVAATAGNLSLSVAGGAEVAVTGGNLNLSGNVLIGNTTASGTLTLRATSNATDGAIVFQSDPTTELGRALATGEFAWGVTSMPAASDYAAFQRNNGTGQTIVKILNLTDGTACEAGVIGQTGSAGTLVSSRFYSVSTLFTTSGIDVAGAVVCLGAGAGITQMNVGTGAAVPLTFWTSSVERARFTTDPMFLFGNTTPVNATNVAEFRRNQNAATAIREFNATDGTAASTSYLTLQGSGGTETVCVVRSYSTSFTTSGINVAGAAAVIGDGAGITQMNVGTNTNTPLTFWTNGVERARITTDPVLLIGLTSASTATDIAEFQRNQNNASYIQAYNTTSGTAAQCGYFANQNSGGTLVTLRMYSLDPAYTTASYDMAGSAVILAGGGGLTSLNVVTSTADPITFWTNATEAGRILSTRELAWGRTTLISAAEIAVFEKNQNDSTSFSLSNTTSGTAAIVGLRLHSGSGGTLSRAVLNAYSNGYTSAGLQVAGSIALLGEGNAGQTQVTVGTIGAHPVVFGTNNVERARILSSGAVLINATAQLGSELFLVRQDQNAATVTRFHNDTSGTAAQVATLWTNATDQGAIAVYSPLFTPAGGVTGSQFTLTTNSGCAGGLNIRTHTTAIPIIFTVNAVEVARFVGTTGIAQFAPPAQSTGTTALLNITSAVNTAGAVPYFSVTGAASTGQTASTEIAFANFNFAQTVTWATGALATERCFLVQAPTLDFAAASTVTTATTMAITRAPASAGANSIITNAFGLQVGGAATLGATAAGTIYGAIDVPSHTITYTGSTQITSAGPAGIRIGTLTVTDASAVTIDTAAGLYIAAAPIAAGSVTITNAYALWVAAGAARFGGRVLETQGADVASANDLTLGAGGNSFNITGSTQINAITTAGWQNGAMITLIFATAVTLKHNTAGGAGTAVMYLAGSADFSATARDTLTLKLLVDSGTTAWFEVARTVI